MKVFLKIAVYRVISQKKLNREGSSFLYYFYIIFSVCRITGWLRLAGTSGAYLAQPSVHKKRQLKLVAHNHVQITPRWELILLQFRCIRQHAPLRDQEFMC